ncbi:MAG: hydantoinase/oxoprolinase family protein, partial [Xanthobacteraceae bacterium]
MLVVAIDIGGTFTDLLGFDEKAGRFIQAKSLTTPAHLVQGIVDCLNKSGISASAIDELIHGSTIAINTLIERKGAKTGLVVTRGARDVYIIGRGNRPEAYNLLFHRHRPLVARRLTREVDERVLATGEIHEPLRHASVEDACEALVADGVEAVAVCFLHSYLDPEHERQAGAIIGKALPDAYLSLSHDILREYREFERISTTVVNAYIGPKVGGYVSSLKSNLGDIGFKGNLSIMRSNGGVMTPEVATERPVAMMESGPVGGIIASAQVGQALGFDNVISFDMGGTTAKASLVKDGEPTLAPGYYVGGYASGHPVMLPMIDVVEVGAGGGSIAWIDEIGALKVGPQSAGADPGPICYRGGGTEPTITDANVVLGRLDPNNFLGGQMKLDAEGAARGIEEKVARPLKMDTVAAAQAILEIAISKMSLAVREVSVQKGYDPRDFALVASGGAGPLHVLPIARELHIPTVIVPLFASHFSALGMLVADERHDFIRTSYSDLAGIDFKALVKVYE